MRGERRSSRRRYTAGDYALIFGLIAVTCVLIPVIGDALSAPVAVLAVSFGLIGIWRWDEGRAQRVLPAAVGVALGAISLFAVVFMLIVVSPA